MTSEEVPVWASHLFEQLCQSNCVVATVNNKITALEDKVATMDSRITSVSKRLEDVATQVIGVASEVRDVNRIPSRLELRLIKMENRTSIINTDDRALPEVPNGAGLVPSSANPAPLANFSALTSLSNEEIRRYFAFYGISNSNSGEKNRQALRACLGVPLMPQRIYSKKPRTRSLSSSFPQLRVGSNNHCYIIIVTSY